MEKLKRTIQQLDEMNFEAFEAMLLKNKSDKIPLFNKSLSLKEVPDSDRKLHSIVHVEIRLCMLLKFEALRQACRNSLSTKNRLHETNGSEAKTESYDQYLYEFPHEETAIAMLA